VKQAEESAQESIERLRLALVESEARYRSLIELAQHSFWETDAAHRVTAASDAAAFVAALPVADLIGKSFWDAPSTIPDEAGWRGLQKTFERHEPFRYFEVSRLANGGERHHVLSGEPRFDPGGRFLGYRGFSRDVTERVVAARRAHEAGEHLRSAFQRANERLESALEGGMVSIWDTDLRTGEVWLSDGWAALVGGPPGETRTTVDELMALTHPDDLQEVKRRSAETVRGERASYTEEHRVRTLTGEWCWVLSRGKVAERDAGGRAVRMTGTNVDITERKRAEEALATSEAHFRAVFERSNAGIAMWDVDGTYLAANTAYCEFVGYTADDLIGKVTAGELRLPGDNEGFDMTGRMVRGEVAFTSRDRRYQRRDGSDVWGRTTVAAVKGNDGMPQHFISVVIDITEARQVRERNERINIELEERVAERTVELRSALKELDAFAYSVSHDLRAPVGAVSGLAHLLRTGEAPRLTDDGKRLLGMIEGNAERMVNLIEGLLRLSQLGRGAIKRIPLSMEELAREVVRDLAGGTRARIEVDAMPPCEGEPAIIRQVWANLIGNALKYSRKRDGARVDIGWDMEKKAYFVRDNGVGFDMQYAAKLFGAFERLHGEAEFEGSGIGLAIVQRILERHGGKIWAEAAPDRGATFWFTVPAPASARKR